MVKWEKCSGCGEPVSEGAPDSYLVHVVYDEWQRVQVYECGACFDFTIWSCFFAPVADGDEDLWDDP